MQQITILRKMACVTVCSKRWTLATSCLGVWLCSQNYYLVMFMRCWLCLFTMAPTLHIILLLIYLTPFQFLKLNISATKINPTVDFWHTLSPDIPYLDVLDNEFAVKLLGQVYTFQLYWTDRNSLVFFCQKKGLPFSKKNNKQTNIECIRN